ncbi:hypothetical protein NA78x_001718 [Anatilimnocola sp. NA78]|uniref:hypothetical protein n=1 Tax=Anatilimnocola sp. NA78 TaxID=3415683 RepID=UPI003CE5833B
MSVIPPLPCCCPGCTIYRDDFESDSLAAGWDERAGDSSIADGVLSIEDASALLVANAAHPGGDYQSSVSRAKVRFSESLDVARITILGEDDDNYLFMELWIDEAGCGHARAYERVSGTDNPISPEYSLPFSLALDELHTASLCYVPDSSNPGKLTMRVSSGDNVWTREAETSTGWLVGDRAGVGTGATVAGTIDFDDFAYLHYYDEAEHPTCPQCKAATSCTLHTDNFNRSDSTDVGCAWEEIAEDWSIDTNELTVAAADALLLNRTPHPNNDAHVQHTFKFRAASGAKPLAFFDWTDDDNFLYVLFEPGSHGDCGLVSFWRRDGGSDEQLGTSSIIAGMSVDDQHTVTVCWKGELLKVTVAVGGEENEYNGGSHSVHGVEQVSTEPLTGLGTLDSAGQVWFDDCTLSRIRDEDNTGCPDCEAGNCLLYCGDPREYILGEDVTDLNCLWEIIVGDWAIEESADLVVFALCGNLESIKVTDSDSILINHTGHPGTTAEGFLDLTSGAYIEVGNTHFGNVVKLLLGVEDEDNYLFAEVTYAASTGGTGTLKIGKVVAGTPTTINTVTIPAGGAQPHTAGIDPDIAFREFAHQLWVCYDGYELKAIWVGSVLAFTDTSYVRGVAGLGWNPGKSGIATGTMTGAAYFFNFRFWHDIYGGESDFCLPCSFAAECEFCGTNDGVDDCFDRTPAVMLVDLRESDIVSRADYVILSEAGGGSYDNEAIWNCDSENFLDVFALPLFSTGNNLCIWQMYHPSFCSGKGAAATTPPKTIELRISQHFPGGGPTAYYQYVVNVTGKSDTNTSSPGSIGFTNTQIYTETELFTSLPLGELYNTGCDVSDLPAANQQSEGMDCLAHFADWITVPHSGHTPYPNPPVSTRSFLMGIPQVGIAKFKVMP